MKGNQEERQSTGHSWKDKFVGGHHLQRAADVGRLRTLKWCRRCAGKAWENRLGKRLRDVGKPGDPRLSYQVRLLEEDYRIERQMENCRRGCRSPRVNFRVSVLPSWLSVGDGTK